MENQKIIYEYRDTILKTENVSFMVKDADGKDKMLLHDINFEERDVFCPGMTRGQLIAFLGDSGRGKSTLFKLLSGLVKPTTGSIMIPDLKKGSGGKIVQEGDVGLVDQKYTLFRDLTIYQALMFAASKGNIPKDQRDPIVRKYLHDWKLEEAMYNYPNKCSGGQQQRAAVIQQLLCSKNFILMDEPFSGLSVRGIDNLKDIIRLTCESHELNTILFSTHDINLAVELADQVYIIGYPKDEKENLIRSGTIVNQYNLKDMGLAWQPFGEAHLDLVRQIKADIINS